MTKKLLYVCIRFIIFIWMTLPFVIICTTPLNSHLFIHSFISLFDFRILEVVRFLVTVSVLAWIFARIRTQWHSIIICHVIFASIFSSRSRWSYTLSCCDTRSLKPGTRSIRLIYFCTFLLKNTHSTNNRQLTERTVFHIPNIRLFSHLYPNENELTKQMIKTRSFAQNFYGWTTNGQSANHFDDLLQYENRWNIRANRVTSVTDIFSQSSSIAHNSHSHRHPSEERKEEKNEMKTKSLLYGAYDRELT